MPAQGDSQLKQILLIFRPRLRRGRHITSGAVMPKSAKRKAELQRENYNILNTANCHLFDGTFFLKTRLPKFQQQITNYRFRRFNHHQIARQTSIPSPAKPLKTTAKIGMTTVFSKKARNSAASGPAKTIARKGRHN